MSIFRKQDPKEEMRTQQKALRKTNRELERDRSGLDRQEKQIENEIKKAAKRGDKQAAGVYAKQLIRLRQQKTKSMGLSSQITSTGYQMKAMESQAKMAGAMGSTAKAMGAMNKQMKVEDIQKTMMNFEQESTRMDMAGELMDDTLDSLLAGSDDEEEEDAVITQVLDEIGIDVQRKLDGVGVASNPLSGRKETTSARTDDIEARLRQLHST